MRESFPFIFYVAICALNVVAIVVMSTIMGPKRKSKNKFTVYECGLTPTRDSRQKFNVNFYLTAVVFLLFDIEIVFLLPWAGAYHDQVTSAAPLSSGLFRLGELGFFMALLFIGLLFVYRRKALKWE